MTGPQIERTRVGIVGGGPAGLMLSHLLHRAGIESVVLDDRSRREIENTVRAGILEADSVRLLVDSGVSDRVLRNGDEHQGVELRYAGENHRVDFKALVGQSVWLYPQTDVFVDLANARDRDGGDVRFGVRETTVLDVLSESPGVRYVDAEGVARELRCDVLVGADGSRSVCRLQLPESQRRTFATEYPFAWFGFLVEAPRSAAELVYAHSERGFALISQRTEAVQRMYFQCDPDTDVADWPEDRIWAEMQARVAGPDGFVLKEGRIADPTVLRFRSFVCEPMRYGNLLLAGDAAHTVPPTGAKGLNLALADVRVLAEVLEQALVGGRRDALDGYGPRALQRVWRAQHFSHWMTQLLHLRPDASDFDTRRQIAELASVTSSEAGRTYLAEAYTGWPTAGSSRSTTTARPSAEVREEPASIVVPHRVEWFETDAAGHQHYTAVARWFEIAETDLHERLGIAATTFSRLPKVKLEIDYLDRLYFGETVDLRVAVRTVGRSSIAYDYEVSTERGVAARGACVCVFADPAVGGSQPWPEDIRTLLLTAGDMSTAQAAGSAGERRPDATVGRTQ